MGIDVLVLSIKPAQLFVGNIKFTPKLLAFLKKKKRGA